MVDVLHYFFDEDMRYGSVEAAQMHGTFRKYVYKDLYERPYIYGIGTGNDAESTFAEDGTEIKPYIPPTEFDAETGMPLANLLDAPLK